MKITCGEKPVYSYSWLPGQRSLTGERWLSGVGLYPWGHDRYSDTAGRQVEVDGARIRTTRKSRDISRADVLFALIRAVAKILAWTFY
jgi:hypothetical protein